MRAQDSGGLRSGLGRRVMVWEWAVGATVDAVRCLYAEAKKKEKRSAKAAFAPVAV